MKIDFSKAFDRLEWPVVKEILNRLGFHRKFTQLMTDTMYIYTQFLNFGQWFP